MTGAQKIIKYCAMALAVLLIVNIFSGIMKILAGIAILIEGSTAGDWKSYVVSEAVTELDIQVDAAELIISNGENWLVSSNNEHLSVRQRGGKLTVKENGGIFAPSEGVTLEITVPAQSELDTAAIIAGAGRVRIEALAADDLRLNFGAGDVSIGTLLADRQAVIEGGAGKIEIENGTLRDLDLDMGMGELQLTSALLGACSFDMGVGAADIELVGSQESYRIEYTSGIGRTTVNGVELPREGTYGFGENELEISGGIGDIAIRFR